MLLSMTGFGKSDVSFNNRTYNINLKSVNSKNADFNIKLPSAYRDKEGDVRAILAKHVRRGKVDLFVAVDNSENETTSNVNESLLKTYLAQLMQTSKGLNVSDDSLFNIALKMPNVISNEKEEQDDNEWKKILEAIEKAVLALVDFRTNEGRVLQEDLSNRVDKISELLEKIIPFESERVDSVKERIRGHLDQLEENDKVNKDRFEQEIIYYLEKLDITEEKVRLKAHCELFTKTMNEDQSQGRKLGFVAQEMGREINTIGSKANHAGIQQIVVDMKDELEKIKEQLFNIL